MQKIKCTVFFNGILYSTLSVQLTCCCVDKPSESFVVEDEIVDTGEDTLLDLAPEDDSRVMCPSSYCKDCVLFDVFIILIFHCAVIHSICHWSSFAACCCLLAHTPKKPLKGLLCQHDGLGWLHEFHGSYPFPPIPAHFIPILTISPLKLTLL